MENDRVGAEGSGGNEVWMDEVSPALVCASDERGLLRGPEDELEVAGGESVDCVNSDVVVA